MQHFEKEKLDCASGIVVPLSSIFSAMLEKIAANSLSMSEASVNSKPCPITNSITDPLEALHQHFKQRASIINPDIDVNLGFSGGFCAIVMRQGKSLADDSVIVITTEEIYYQSFARVYVKKVEWADPQMLETVEGWMLEMRTKGIALLNTRIQSV